MWALGEEKRRRNEGGQSIWRSPSLQKRSRGPLPLINSILLFLSFPLLAHFPVLFDSPLLLSLFLETVRGGGQERPQRSHGSDWTSALRT